MDSYVESVSSSYDSQPFPEYEDTYSECDEEDDEEEIEPKLKYERIGNDLANILSKDAASCMAIHSKFLALGTHWGIIHILDHCGNNVHSKELPAHSTTVNQISIDDDGEYIASCSDDGRVVINGLYSTENNQIIHFDRPVKAVALDPAFSKSGKGKHFVTGDDKLILNEKGFLNRNKTYILHEGEGQIRNIRWRSSFIAWANDNGVKVYDMSSKKRITFIARDKPNLRTELYQCNICWKDDRTFIIGWADSVKICVIRDRTELDYRDLPNRYVEITAMFTTDFFVCGIAPHQNNIAILTYDEDQDPNNAGKPLADRPHVRIIEPNMDCFEELSNDALSIRSYQDYRCIDYHLEFVNDETIYYIVSPKDIVVAKQRDQDDHITWLMDHGMFEDAMIAATEHEKLLKKHNYRNIGKEYLAFLLKEEQYAEAGHLCVKILGKNKELWEEEVYKFAKIKQLKAIAPYLPQDEPRLSPVIYEMVLNEFLQTDIPRFKSMIKEWSCDLYNIQTLINAVLDRLSHDRQNAILLQCLGELYKHNKQFDKALGIYLKLKHRGVFDLIHTHDLFDSINDKIVMLMDFDQDAAVKMFLDNIDRVPPEKVVHQLQKTPRLLHLYLDQLFKKDPQAGQDYHALQVKLYAEFDPGQLLPFLRNGNTQYPLQKAFEECQARERTPEMVYLLSRMGNTKQALQLITNELHDVDQAIQFCKEHNDEDLWEDLIHFSIHKPSFITGLLQNIGTHVDPIILIKKIKEGMEIPGLRDSLVKILQDYNLQISLRKGCRNILVSDCFSLMERLIRTQKRGISVDEYQSCQACLEKICSNSSFRTSFFIFYCRHAFHEECLPPEIEHCPNCSAKRYFRD